MSFEFESIPVSQAKSNFESPSHQDVSFESDAAVSSAVTSRLTMAVGCGPSLQSTVKVESRKESTVDRYKVCPLLLRVFYTYNKHHDPIDYMNKQYPKNEMHIHTWMDATLAEIIINLQRKNRKVRRSGTVIKFQLISPDPARPRYRTRDVGSIKIDYKGPDDLKTLSQCRYTIGDFVDLCIKLPKN